MFKITGLIGRYSHMNSLVSDVIYELFTFLSSYDSVVLSKINKKFTNIHTNMLKVYYRVSGSFVFVPTLFLPYKFYRAYTYSFNPLQQISNNVKYISQREMIIVNNNHNDKKYKYIGTIGIATCIVFFGFCKSNQVSFMVHFDVTSNVHQAIMLLNIFLQECDDTDDDTYKIWIKGGYLGYSEELLNRIMNSIKNCLTVKYMMIYENVLDSLMVKSAAIDITSGEYFDFIIHNNNFDVNNNYTTINVSDDSVTDIIVIDEL